MAGIENIYSDERPLRISIIVLSDRASRGEYEDKGGPRIRERIEQFFKDAPFPIDVTLSLIPDDEMALQDQLDAARRNAVDVIFTTGGTGVGPRDITPDVVEAYADRIIPGVMDSIRIKYGEQNPFALLSRSVAAIAGATLIYTLPGSPKGIDEYLDEIEKTLKHTLAVVNDLDVH